MKIISFSRHLLNNLFVIIFFSFNNSYASNKEIHKYSWMRSEGLLETLLTLESENAERSIKCVETFKANPRDLTNCLLVSLHNYQIEKDASIKKYSSEPDAKLKTEVFDQNRDCALRELIRRNEDVEDCFNGDYHHGDGTKMSARDCCDITTRFYKIQLKNCLNKKDREK